MASKSRKIVFFFLIFILPISAYAFSIQRHLDPTHVKVIIPYPPDLVWKWALRALNHYKVETNSFVDRNLATHWIKDAYNINLFKVFRYFPKYEDVKTRLRIRLIEEKSLNLTIVNIFKDFKYFKNIHVGWTKIEPDGIEEYVVGYRIRQLAYYHYVIVRKKKEAEEAEEE